MTNAEQKKRYYERYLEEIKIERAKMGDAVFLYMVGTAWAIADDKLKSPGYRIMKLEALYEAYSDNITKEVI